MATAAGLTASAAEQTAVPAQAAGLSTETLGRHEDTLPPTDRAAFVRALSAATSMADRREAFRHAGAPAWAVKCVAADLAAVAAAMVVAVGIDPGVAIFLVISEVRNGEKLYAATQAEARQSSFRQSS